MPIFGIDVMVTLLPRPLLAFSNEKLLSYRKSLCHLENYGEK